MSDIIVKTNTKEDLVTFLQLNGFQIEDLGQGVSLATREGELPVFLKAEAGTLFFEVDLGNLDDLGGNEKLFELLDLNTEILPVSFGINSTNPEDPRLVLLESRQTANLDDNELLGVFDALELATDRAEQLLG
jgi:hypothetical protein